jgi:predicted cupin superfamily sugar epimerase
MDAERLISTLGLSPHPEGGHFREVYRDTPVEGGRGALTSIYYLLRAGESSHWHRIDATEIWCFHTGSPLRLSTSADGMEVDIVEIGGDPENGGHFQSVVPPGVWQSAVSLGSWTLVGCMVAPAFEFAGFELAPRDWAPGGVRDPRPAR